LAVWRRLNNLNSNKQSLAVWRRFNNLNSNKQSLAVWRRFNNLNSNKAVHTTFLPVRTKGEKETERDPSFRERERKSGEKRTSSRHKNMYAFMALVATHCYHRKTNFPILQAIVAVVAAAQHKSKNNQQHPILQAVVAVVAAAQHKSKNNQQHPIQQAVVAVVQQDAVLEPV
jgi:hypothetical protein